LTIARKGDSGHTIQKRSKWTIVSASLIVFPLELEDASCALLGVGTSLTTRQEIASRRIDQHALVDSHFDCSGNFGCSECGVPLGVQGWRDGCGHSQASFSRRAGLARPAPLSHRRPGPASLTSRSAFCLPPCGAQFYFLNLSLPPDALGDDVGSAGHLQRRAVPLRLLQAGSGSVRCQPEPGQVDLDCQELKSQLPAVWRIRASFGSPFLLEPDVFSAAWPCEDVPRIRVTRTARRTSHEQARVLADYQGGQVSSWRDSYLLVFSRVCLATVHFRPPC